LSKLLGSNWCFTPRISESVGGDSPQTSTPRFSSAGAEKMDGMPSTVTRHRCELKIAAGLQGRRGRQPRCAGDRVGNDGDVFPPENVCTDGKSSGAWQGHAENQSFRLEWKIRDETPKCALFVGPRTCTFTPRLIGDTPNLTLRARNGCGKSF
jgi:hypothetical protein